MQESQVIRLEIPSSPEYIIISRRILDAIAPQVALTREQMDDLKLAVGEACSNAVKFSGPGKPAVRITYKIGPDGIEIKVQNRGELFRRGKRQPARPPIDLASEGGLGMFLIDRLSDELNIRSQRGTTTVRIVKHCT